MGWSDKYKKSIDCNNPKGFSQRAHCQGRKKKVKEQKDHEVSMANSQLDNAIANAKKLKAKLGKKEKDIPAWVQAKITDTDHNMDAAASSMKEDLRKWFGTGGEGGVGGGGWDRYNTKGERIGKCAREPGEAKPKCLSKEKAAKMSKDEIAAAVRRKRTKDPVADRPGKGGKPVMSSNKIETQEAQDYQKFDRRVNAAMKANTADLKIKLLKLAGQAHPSSQVKTAEEFMEACWKGYKQVGMKKKGKRMVPNCVPEETELDEMIALAAPIVRGVSAVSKIGQGVTKAGQAVKTGAKAVGSKIKDVAKKIPGEVEKQPVDKKELPLDTKKLPQSGLKKDLKRAGQTAKSAVKTTVGGFSSMYEPREEYIMEKNVPTNPSLWSRAKAQARAKFDVYPSAYANGWAAKWYKSKGGGWKTAAKEGYDETRELLSFSDFRQISTNCRTDEAVDASKYGKTPDQLLQSIIDRKKLGGQVVKTGLQKANEGVGMTVAKAIGNPPPLSKRMKVKRHLIVREIEKNTKANKSKKYSGKADKVAEAVAAWQRKAGKSEKGGLNEKGRKSYEAENPGSDLKAPSKKVGNPRRASFCARMSGMKKKLTSKKTANDPNSRINKSLRAWNC